MFRRHGCQRACRYFIVAVLVFAIASVARAQTDISFTSPELDTSTFDNNLNIPDVRGVLPKAEDAEGVGASLQILVLLTVLTLVPSIMVMMTAFPRIIIVLALLRQAVGTPQLPPSQVILGLSLFLTGLIMAPTYNRIHSQAIEPYFNSEMGQREALSICSEHLKVFMYQQIEHVGNQEDIYLFLEYAEQRAIPATEKISVGQCPLTVMVPAFMLSELKTAFIMGFRIYLPFLVIDMVIAMILISMGMMMLPPVLISLPFKVLLFVLADGWHLVVETLLYSFVQPYS